MEPVTLVSPDGREYVATTPVELNDLTMGQGYMTQEQANARKSKSTKKSTSKNESTKDDNPTPAKQDSGHSPSTDAN